jgi:hypothetical protein
MGTWTTPKMWELWSFFVVRIQNLAHPGFYYPLRPETALMHIGTLGTRQGEVQESARDLYGSRPFRLVRMREDSVTGVEDRGLHALTRDDDEDDDEEEEEEEEETMYWRQPHAKTPKWFPPVTTPQEAGKRLLVSGEFGRIGVETRFRNGGTSFAKAIASRQIKLRQTPMQDVTNVSGVLPWCFYVPLSHERRVSSPTPTVRPLRLLPIIYTVDNTQLVRIRPDYYVFVS